MRIAFITYEYFPVAGGVETRTYFLASELAKRHSVTVYTRKLEERRRHQFNHEIVEVEYSRLGGIRGIDFLRKIRSDVDAREFDVVNVEQFGVHTFVAKEKSVKLGVITAHGNDVVTANLFLRLLYQSVVKDDKVRIVSVSDYMRTVLLDKFHVPKAKVTVIPHGVDLALFKPVSKKRRNTFLFVGRFDREKDPLSCIEAFEILLRRHKVADAALNMVGDGPLLTAAKDLVREKGLELHIRLVGKISNIDLTAYYSEAVATVCPRDAGLVLLESMACGTPLIAGKIGKTPEMIKPETGYLVEASNPHEIAEAMAKVSTLKDEELAKISSACREHCEQYSWQKIAQKLESMYKQGLNETTQ